MESFLHLQRIYFIFRCQNFIFAKFYSKNFLLNICGFLKGIDLCIFVFPGRQHYHQALGYDTVTVKISCWKIVGFWRESISVSSWSQVDNITTRYFGMTQFLCATKPEIWVTYINNVLSNKTILFHILDFWCQLVVIRFVKTLSKRRMFVSSMKISACWLLHRLIKFNKICWEKRPAKTRPNLRTSFCRRDLNNTKPHLKVRFLSGIIVALRLQY